MTSRERVIAAINHQPPDQVPLDLNGTDQTGISASALYRLRKALGLEVKPITCHDPYQVLGWVDEDVLSAVKADVIGIWNPVNFTGTRNANWKPWQLPDGTPVLMSGDFEYDVDERGDILAYPCGDRTCQPSLRMPKDGYFFDSIVRNGEFNEDELDPVGDYQEAFGLIDDDTARYYERESKRLFEETDYAIVGNLGVAGFGDMAALPGHFLRHPKGIRKADDWLMAHYLYPDYVKGIFQFQLEQALKNLVIYRQAVGNRIQVVWLSGADYGTQKGEFVSPDMFRKFYKPHIKAVNDWVHAHTTWKTLYHTCGSIVNLLDDMVEAGIDALNPVQCSAAGMDPKFLKEKYGDRIVFWGGGVDTQKVLPFGTPDEVRRQVRERLENFSPGGGFVFNPIHNILPETPVENILAMYDEFQRFNQPSPVRL